MSLWLRALRYFIFALAVILIVTLLAVSYTTTLYVLLGTLATLLLVFIVPYILRLGAQRFVILGIWIASLLCIVTLMFGLFLQPAYLIRCTPGEKREIELTEYQAVIKPIEFSSGSFGISEKVTYDVKSVVCKQDYTVSKSVVEKDVVLSLPEKQITSTARGFLIRELRIVPLANSPLGVTNCCAKLPTIELRDFPRDSFYEAYDVQKMESSHYLDTEIIRWHYNYLDKEIIFAYIAPPFYVFRTLLMPLIGVTYQNQWMIALSSLIASAVVTAILKPLFIESAKNRLKSSFEKNSGKTQSPKTTIIVSGKGDEKEIEIRKKSR
jgi:hypothetical protein